jgi:D-inositol-3-phosphate glycosyltransferase
LKLVDSELTDQISERSRATIAIVVPSLVDIGGVISVATFLQRVIRRDSKFDARFFSLATSASDSSSTLLRSPATWLRGVNTTHGNFNGDPFVHVGASLSEFEFRRYAPRPELRRMLADCDLVQVVAGAPAWVLPVAGCGKPIILQVATLTKVERRTQDKGPSLLGIWRRLMTHVTARYDEAGLRAADAIMVENPWMLDYARAASGSGTIVRYAPPGVDIDIFKAGAACDTEPGGSPYILAVGRFCDRRKNADLLLDAFSRVLRLVLQPLRLVVAGADDPGDTFRAKVGALGLDDKVSVRLKLSNQALAELYRNAVCLALSSDEEGLGIVVLEAMASGIPVVATRCGGPDGIITDGVDGFLVPIGDAAAMADRLALLVRNTAVKREMGEKARLTIKARYSEEVAGKAFLDVYHELLSKPKAAGRC